MMKTHQGFRTGPFASTLALSSLRFIRLPATTDQRKPEPLTYEKLRLAQTSRAFGRIQDPFHGRWYPLSYLFPTCLQRIQSSNDSTGGANPPRFHSFHRCCPRLKHLFWHRASTSTPIVGHRRCQRAGSGLQWRVKTRQEVATGHRRSNARTTRSVGRSEGLILPEVVF